MSRTMNAMMMPIRSVSLLVLAWATCPPKLTVIPAALAGPPESSGQVGKASDLHVLSLNRAVTVV
jgi:hypothetical protein